MINLVRTTEATIPSTSATSPSAVPLVHLQERRRRARKTFTELEKRNEKQTPENRRTSGLHSAYRTYQEANHMGKKAKKKSSARKPAQLPTMDSTTSTVYRWSMPQVSDRNSCRAAGSIPRNNPAQVCQPHPRPCPQKKVIVTVQSLNHSPSTSTIFEESDPEYSLLEADVGSPTSQRTSQKDKPQRVSCNVTRPWVVVTSVLKRVSTKARMTTTTMTTTVWFPMMTMTTRCLE